MITETDFYHLIIPGEVDAPVLLLLHGTGGDEHDLVGLAQAVLPAATILSVRGKVLENGMPRFFRRMAEGVFDLEDLAFRTDELADFVMAVRAHEHIKSKPIIALGFSNGANIAASMFFQRPEVLDGGILLRAMVPFEPKTLPDLSAKKILMVSGLMDAIIPLENAKTLSGLLQKAKANVDFLAKPAGHGLVQSDVTDIKNWLSKYYA